MLIAATKFEPHVQHAVTRNRFGQFGRVDAKRIERRCRPARVRQLAETERHISAQREVQTSVEFRTRFIQVDILIPDVFFTQGVYGVIQYAQIANR